MRVVARLHDVAVVGQPVQQRRGHLGVAEHAGPFGEAQVGSDRHAVVLVELGQQIEQQSAARLTERPVPQLNTDHQIHAQQRLGNPTCRSRDYENRHPAGNFALGRIPI